MGNDCSKPCKKSKTSRPASSSRNPNSLNHLSSSNNRETINQFSLTTFKEVQSLANKGDISKVKQYLETGFLVDFPLDQSGWTLLHLACQKGNISLVETILKHHPYLDAQELAEGWSPLMVSAVNDFEEIFKILEKAGADRFLKDNSGKNVFDLVEKYKSVKVKQVIQGVN
jgi:ankyrin repeat protein